MDKIVNLSITKKNVPVRVDVVQYATAPNIVFALDDFMPQGTADIYIEKPSGMKVFSHLTIEDNRLTLVPTTQAFAEVGISKAQLLISDGTADAISFLIFFYVTENIIDSSAIESQNEFTALQEALNTVGQYDARITSVEREVTTIDTDMGDLEDRVAFLEERNVTTDQYSQYAPDYATVSGYVTNSSKRVVISVPFGRLVNQNIIFLTNLAVAMRHAGGGYPYSKNSDGTYTRLGDGTVMIWEDEQPKSMIESINVTQTFLGMVNIEINFKSALKVSGSDDATNVPNNTPIAVTLGRFAIYVDY